MKGRFSTNKNLPSHTAIDSIKQIIDICATSNDIQEIIDLLKKSLSALHKFEIEYAFRLLDENNPLQNEQKHWDTAKEFWNKSFNSKCSVLANDFLTGYVIYFNLHKKDCKRYVYLLAYLLKLKNDEQKISCNKFGDFIATLGPIIDENDSHDAFIERVCYFYCFFYCYILFIYFY